MPYGLCVNQNRLPSPEDEVCGVSVTDLQQIEQRSNGAEPAVGP
jgi:hypothetical protein